MRTSLANLLAFAALGLACQPEPKTFGGGTTTNPPPVERVERIPNNGGTFTADDEALIVRTYDEAFDLRIPRGAFVGEVQLEVTRTAIASATEVVTASVALALRSDVFTLQGPQGTELKVDAEVRVRLAPGATVPANPVIGFIKGAEVRAVDALEYDDTRRTTLGITREFGILGVVSLPDCIGSHITDVTGWFPTVDEPAGPTSTDGGTTPLRHRVGSGWYEGLCRAFDFHAK